MTVPDGNASTPPCPLLTDARLRWLVVTLGPLGEIDSTAGLRARSRDPREMPGTGGEQRDAAAALDAAHDRGELAAHRAVHRRVAALAPELQTTARWLGSWGGAVRRGAVVTVVALVAHYAETEAPLALREAWASARDAHNAAANRYAASKRAGARRLTNNVARTMNEARGRAEQAAGEERRAREALGAWSRGRLERFVTAWDATDTRSEED